MPRHRKGVARPFLKWAGGKTQLLPELAQRLPTIPSGATYHEPFVGSGALFFHLAATGSKPARARISDSNARLVDCYVTVRDEPRRLARRLRELHADHSEEHYYLQRERFNEEDLDGLERAALLVYLNKTGFNGLYRVNRRGRFNVPVGRSVSPPTVPDEEHLAACSHALRRAVIEHAPFESVLEHARRGDVVYFDPPYVPVSATAFFTDYDVDGFGPADQARLRDVFAELARRRCRVLLSNSDAPAVRELYADFPMDVVSARRSINSRATARGPVGELIVRDGLD